MFPPPYQSGAATQAVALPAFAFSSAYYAHELTFPFYVAGFAFLAVILRTTCFLSGIPIPSFPGAAFISYFTIMVYLAIWMPFILAFTCLADIHPDIASLVAAVIALPLGWFASGACFARLFRVSFKQGLWISLMYLAVAGFASMGVAGVVGILAIVKAFL